MSLELGIHHEDDVVVQLGSITNGKHISSANVINESVKIDETNPPIETDLPTEKENLQIQEIDLPIEEKDVPIEEKDIPIEEKDMPIKEKGMLIKEKDMLIKEKDMAIKEKDIPIDEKECFTIEEEDLSIKEDIPHQSQSVTGTITGTEKLVDGNGIDIVKEHPQVETVFVNNQVSKKKYPLRKTVRSVSPKTSKRKKELLIKARIITDEKKEVNELTVIDRGEVEYVVIDEIINKSSDENYVQSDDIIVYTCKAVAKTRKSKNKSALKDPNRTKLGWLKKERKQKSENNKTIKDIQRSNTLDIKRSNTLDLNKDSCESKKSQDVIHLEEPKGPKPKVRKPRECDVCKRVFANYGSLKEHKRIHSGEKPFICPICGIGCIRRGHLKQHIYHHTGEWPYKCAACGKGFINQSRIQRHMRVHSDDRPFLCDICGEGFKEPHHLTRHFLLHTGEKPFKCELCPDRYFLQHGNLKIHMKTHQNGGKPKRQTTQNSASCSWTSSVGDEEVQRTYQEFKELVQQNKQNDHTKTVFTTQSLLCIPKEANTTDEELETPINISSQFVNNKASEYNTQKGENTLSSSSKQENTCELSSQNVSNTGAQVNLAYTIALPLENSICTTASPNLPLGGTTLTLVDSGNAEGGVNSTQLDVNPNLVQILGNIELTNLSGLQHLETLTTLSEDQATSAGCSQNAYVIAQQLSSAEDGSVIALQLNPEEASAIAQIFLDSQQ